MGRWLRVGHEMRGRAVRAIWLEAGNPLVVIAALVGAGLQRSADGGRSWQTVFTDDVVSLTGGNRHAAQRMYFSTQQGAVYRSDDAGVSWAARANAKKPEIHDSYLLASQPNVQTLYLVLSDGATYISRDAGDSWEQFGGLLPAIVHSFVESPAPAGALYATSAGRLYHTSGMAQWETLDTPELDSGAFALLGGKKATLLVSQKPEGIARRDDAGGSWEETSVDTPWNGSIAVITPASYNIDVAFAGTDGGQLAISADRGRFWQTIRHDLPAIRCIAAARLA
jgi:photosystem II stability/assembly factor-like uncharacterized protein